MSARQLLALILLALVFVFVALNWQRTQINFFGIASFEMPISLAVLGATALGFTASRLLRVVRKPAKR